WKDSYSQAQRAVQPLLVVALMRRFTTTGGRTVKGAVTLPSVSSIQDQSPFRHSSSRHCSASASTVRRDGPQKERRLTAELVQQQWPKIGPKSLDPTILRCYSLSRSVTFRKS